MFVKALLVTSVLALTTAQGAGTGIKRAFLDTSHGQNFAGLMNAHFNNSVNYMLTSKQYDSQYMERPGMAKLLREASDREWEEGMDMLKKYMQRGGNIAIFNDKININAKAQLANYDSRFDSYTTTLDGLLTDAHNRFDTINTLHGDSNKHSNSNNRIPDFDIGHYLDNKLSEEAEIIYKLKSHKTTLDQMSSLGVAISMFDEAL